MKKVEMTKDELEKKLKAVTPKLEKLAIDFRTEHPEKVPYVRSRVSCVNFQTHHKAAEIAEAEGLRMSTPVNVELISVADASDIVAYWIASIRYECWDRAAGEVVVTPRQETMRLIRINAPEWFEDEDFMAWLNNGRSATWHIPGSGAAGEYSDAFFTYCQGEGSDYPGSPDQPGIPEYIWNQIGFHIADRHSWRAEAFVWVSNLK